MDELVQRLSSRTWKVAIHGSESAEQFRGAIERGFALVRFPDTQGSTCLGVRLVKERCAMAAADFDAGSGTVQLVGTLVLNYNEVELAAQIDISTLAGEGSLRLIADEATWRAKQAEKEKPGGEVLRS